MMLFEPGEWMFSFDLFSFDLFDHHIDVAQKPIISTWGFHGRIYYTYLWYCCLDYYQHLMFSQR